MAQSYSFDVVSKINMEEVLNAVAQSTREMSQRFDFKGSKSSIELNQSDNEITVVGDDDMKLKNVIDILRGRMAKREVPLKGLEYGKIEQTFSGTVTQKIKVQSGLTKDQCKEVTKIIKGLGAKVKSTMQDGQVRVSGSKKDDLQTVMTALREKDLDYHLEFDNYR